MCSAYVHRQASADGSMVTQLNYTDSIHCKGSDKKWRSFPSCPTEHVHQQRQNGCFPDGIQRSNRVWIWCYSLMKSWMIIFFLHKICTCLIRRLVSQFYSSLGCFYPSGTNGRVVSSNTGVGSQLVWIMLPTWHQEYTIETSVSFSRIRPHIMILIYGNGINMQECFQNNCSWSSCRQSP